MAWTRKNERNNPVEYIRTGEIKDIQLQIAERNQFWFEVNAENIYTTLVEQLGYEKEMCSKKFGEVRPPDYKSDDQWLYSDDIGLHRAI